MSLRVVGAGVGRTGTASLKIALERLLGGRCHHMIEVFSDPAQIPLWTEAIEGGAVDWSTMPPGFTSIVDWPGASFWRELSGANPDALVLLSVRDPEAWYRSASNTIFLALDGAPLESSASPSEMSRWMESVRRLLSERFCDQVRDPTAMMEAFERHNESVRREIPSHRLLEWTAADGWEPICERLGVPVPDVEFPRTNTLNEWRANFGLEPISD